MATILVTGGAGFIGSNFVNFWHKLKPEDTIVILDLLTYAGNLANLSAVLNHENIRFIHGDICDQSLVAELYGQHNINTVVHFAAESHVDRSIVAPDEFIRTNVEGTHTLLKHAVKAWANHYDGKRFHHVSSDEVYGSLTPHGPAFTESSPYDPRSPYAASKAAADMLVRSYGHTFGLPVTISNSSNNYGPNQFPEKVIPLMILNALLGRALPVYGDGLHVRDWVHVEDHCAALFTLLTQGKPGETYNIGGGNEMRNIDIVRTLCGLIDERFANLQQLAERFPECPAAAGESCLRLITYVTDRPGHDRRYAIDAGKIERECGAPAQRPLTKGLADTVDWYLNNEAWWRPIQSGAYRQWIAHQYGVTI